MSAWGSLPEWAAGVVCEEDVMQLVVERVPGKRGTREVLERPAQFGEWLDARGKQGVATWEVRAAGYANPSQVAADVVKGGRKLVVKRERAPSGVLGARYWDKKLGPKDADKVPPACARKKVVEPYFVPRPTRAQAGLAESMSIFDMPGVDLERQAAA